MLLVTERGAGDYVTEPFSMRELVLRLRAVLRGQAIASRVGYYIVIVTNPREQGTEDYVTGKLG